MRTTIDAFLDTPKVKNNPNTLRGYAGVLDQLAVHTLLAVTGLCSIGEYGSQANTSCFRRLVRSWASGTAGWTTVVHCPE